MIQFKRRPSAYNGMVQYWHRAIVFIPSEYNQTLPLKDSSGALFDSNKVHVLHLWSSGSKTNSLVRIDQLDNVAMGDNFEVVEDGPGAYPAVEAVSRAMSRMGKLHRSFKYNLAGNNCGHFVAWAKYGSSGRDVQFRDELLELAELVQSKKLARYINKLDKTVQRILNDYD